MHSRSTDTSGHAQLVRIVGQVRRRWRLRLALKGAAVVIAAGLAVVLLAALALEQIGREPAALIALRLLILLALVGLIARYLALPLLQRVSDERVALYLEEHEPTLQAALVSALEAGSQARPVQAEISPALLQRTIEAAIERCREIDEGHRVEQRNLTRFSLLVAGVAAASVAVILLSPAVVKDGASALFFLRQPEAEAAPTPTLSIEVLPGDTTVARGALQTISAQLHGFGSGQVEILTRAEGDTVFARMPMLAAADSNRFELVLFDLDRPTEYFVEAEGVRSRLFRISVADLPYVRRLELEYHFPAYTGLPPQRVEEGGDLAALEGTVARLRITPTMAVAGGSIVLEGGRSIPLQPDSTGALTGALRIEREGLYHVELQAHDGTAVKGSPQYTIDVLRDEAPSVVFTQPGRDTRVTAIEEVFVEARAEDDYGISDLQLVYSVNGGPEQTIHLFQAGRPLTEVAAGHTFYLEELSLQPGDFVSYYARTTDNNGVGGRKSATSDIYFLQIRPFGRNYRQAEERGGPPGGGGAGQGEDAGGIDGALSQRQREIIAATFNLVRDHERYSQKEYQEHLVTVALAQERLREQVQTLAERMVNRRITQDSSFQKIAELLPKAAEEMVAAAANLRESKPGEALPPEQRALQQLQRAEAVYRDVQVTMGQQQGGQSGGGGGSRNAEDLADLFGLELDKLRNQYETVQRGQRQAAQQQVDEAIERLKELARRQEQENERLRRLAMARQNQQGGSASQRQLAEETEAAARQLERLARENSRPDLMNTARRLQEAADAMRRAGGSGSGGAADAEAALNRLQEAQRRLERNREAGLESETQRALRRAEELAAEQRRIASAMQELSGAGPERAEQARRLIERKEQQAEQVADLERQLNRLAAEARREQRDASRKLQEAANAIRESQLEEKIRRSRASTQPGAPQEYVRRFEEQISSDLEELRRRVAEARGAIRTSDERRAAETLERTRDLARGLESMQERMRRAREEAEGRGRAPGQQDQQGQQNQQAQASQGGEEGTAQQGAPAGGDASGRQGGFAPGGGVNRDGGGEYTGNLTPEEIRQFRGELQQRLEQARELRRRLAAEGRDVGDLDRIITGLRALDDQRVYADAAEIERLQTQVVDGLKQLEFALRREIEGALRERPFLSGTAEVPAEFRDLVEEYYRRLSERPRQ